MAANPVIDATIQQIETTKGVIASAVTLIGSIASRIQAAVDAAIAGGATADQLAPVQDEVNTLKDSTDALSAAVAANP